MKKYKKFSYVAIFSVGILSVQVLLAPSLLAEESQNNQDDETSLSINASDQSPTADLNQASDQQQAAAENQQPAADLPVSDQTDPVGDVSADQGEANESSKVEIGAGETEDQPADIHDQEPETDVDDQDTDTDDQPTDPDQSEEESGETDSDTETPDQDDADDQPQDDFDPAEETPVQDEQETADKESPADTQQPDTTNSSKSSADNQGKDQSASQKPKKQLAATTPKVQAPSVNAGIKENFYTGEQMIALDDAYRTSEVAQSDLKGFTLPMLADFSAQWQGAFLYEVMRQIGQPVKTETTDVWVQQLLETIVDPQTAAPATLEFEAEDLQPGDILLRNAAEANIQGLYIGQGYQAMIEEKAAREEENDKETDKEAAKSTDDEAAQKVVAIDRIDESETYTVYRYQSVTLTKDGENLVSNYPAPYTFEVNQSTQTFIDNLAEDAQSLGQKYDVFASVLLAQAILESGSGQSVLAQSPYYNLFGIKGSFKGSSIVLPTMEDTGKGELITIQTAFRSYSCYRDSMADYIQLIRGGISGNHDFYQSVWRSEAKNYLRATDALTGTYATDTTYNKKMNSLIAAYDLTQYDQPVSRDTGVFVQSLDEVPQEYRTLMKLPQYNGKDYNTSGSYPVGQCTWYVYNRVHQLGKTVDDYMGNGGEWGESGRKLGYKVSQTPKAGKIISFSPGTAGSDPRYGHVAFVEAVGPDGILISEGNVYGGTKISYRVIPNELAYSNQVSYIIPKG